MSWQGSGALVWDAERLRIATEAAGVALWSWNVDTDEIAMDNRAHGLWGVARNEATTFEDLSACIHPKDLDKVRAAFTASRSILGTFEIDFRVTRGEAVRWISARGQGADAGVVDRIMFGVFLDVTARKQAEEARELIAAEMSHRVKNLFAVASALTTIASRSAATTTEMARDLTQRLTALGRAHDLVQVIPGRGETKAALLGDLLVVLLAAYDSQDAAEGRVQVRMPEIRVGETSATTLALIVHELATNSIKYGALSATGGTVDVSCTSGDGGVVLVWTERGGPPAAAPTKPAGFGSKLVDRSVSGQLGGSTSYEWLATGVVVTLRMDKARLAT